MSPKTPLHLPHAWLDEVTPWLAADSRYPARLVMGRRGLCLVIRHAAGDWRCPVADAWWPALTAAFAPEMDGLGRLRVRPCLAALGHEGDRVTIDLLPTADGSDEQDAARWPELAPPVAAALLVACVALPTQAATYEVRRGDTLSAISRKLFGTTTGWRQLYQLNRDRLANPDRLEPGTVLQVPDRVSGAAPAASGPAQIVVRPGDTLFSLAKRHLGDGARWRTLWSAVRHRIASPSRLPVGLQIPLPGSETADGATVASVPAPVSAMPPGPAPVGAAEPPPPPDTAVAPVSPGEGEPATALTPPAATDPIAATTGAADPAPAMTEPAVPALVPPSPPTARIERPFASHVGLSFDPVTYHEFVSPQQVTARGTIFNSFGAEAAWRIGDLVEVSGQYLFNGYPMTRVQPTGDRRTEHHGRLTGYVVWPLLPQLELAAGIGGQLTGYGVVAGPPAERPEDVYDTGYQRVLAHGEAKVGWRPWPDRSLTLTAGIQGMPFGQGFRLGAAEPLRIWGVGWSAGLRYTLHGVALETSYRGHRLFGEGYGQSSDLFHTGIAYYFQ